MKGMVKMNTNDRKVTEQMMVKMNTNDRKVTDDGKNEYIAQIVLIK